MRPIGQTIYLWRLHGRLTQVRLAQISGVSRPNLSAIEQGARDLTVQTLRRLAEALGIDAGTLVNGVGPKPTYAPINTDRHSLDRVARLAAGQRLRASTKERKVALALAFVMKSKTGWAGIKRTGRRTARSENETLTRLKAELGAELLAHLVRRIEKHLGGPGMPHE